MLSQKSLLVFYTICGLIVTWMLFRLWRRNRKSTPVIPPPKPRVSPKSLAAKVDESIATQNIVKPVSVEPLTVEATPLPAVVSRATYGGDASAPSADWDGRRLLDSSGVLGRDSNPMPRVLPEDVPGVDDSDRVFGSWLNPAFAVLLPGSPERREQDRKELMSAGYYNPHAVENLAAVRYAFMMVGMILFGGLLLVVPPQLEPYMMIGTILGPLLGWAFPALYIRSQARERVRQIEHAMPDLLDMLNMCVSQGLTVPDSLQRIGRDFRPVYPALSQELAIVNEQSRISSMQTALENLSGRIELPEVHSLTSLLIQTERMGTSISQSLVTYSDTMRESQRQQADEKGNRATFQLLFPTVLCLMPAVYLFLLGPAVVELQKFFYGGGVDSLNSGSQAVQRVSNVRNRNSRNPGMINPRRVAE